MVSDVSRSIGDAEFKLEKDGYAAPFTSPEVIHTIRAGPIGAIGVALLEFAGTADAHAIVYWTVIRDTASAKAFAASLAAQPRSFWGPTAIGSGIDHVVRMLAESGLAATCRVSGVCGGGTSNAGQEVTGARDETLKAGMTINGLAINTEHPVSSIFAHVRPQEAFPTTPATTSLAGRAALC